MATSTLPKVQAQRRLALLWFVLAGLATALLGFRTHGAPDEPEYWKWFSPYVFPLALLMLGTLKTDEATADTARSSVFYFRLCWGLLLFYGLFLLGALFTGLNTPADDGLHAHAMLDSLKESGLLLTAVQSLLSLALGVFFVAPSAKAAPASPPADKSDEK